MNIAIAAGAAAAALLAAGAAAAETRICEATLSGPAGEHTVRLELEDGAIVEGVATWAPPREAARARIEFPRLELRHDITDFETGARAPLRYVTVIHAVRPTQTRARTADVVLGPYTGEPDRVAWDFFARVRDPANTGLRDSEAIAGEIFFTSPQSLRTAREALQIETAVITGDNERLANGVFNLTTRPAMDALFDRAFEVARGHARNPGRECRTLRHDERQREARTR